MLALTGCKTGKTSASGQSGKPDEVVILEKEIIEKENHSKETPGGVTPGQVAYANLDTRYAMLTGSWKAWRDVELGAKIRLLSPAKFNAAGKVYMKRGEWISVSVRMLGFEVATLWLDRDSVVAVDKFHKKYPNKPIGISEYGCEALNWHTSTPEQGDYTEEYQAYYHEEVIKQIIDRPYLWATHVWNMFDFAADARAEDG